MNLKFLCRLLVVGTAGFLSGAAYGYEATFSVGHYEPADGIVNGLYDTKSPSLMLRFAVPRADGLSWSSFLQYYNFESRVANLENNVRLFVLNSGFRKSFYEQDRGKYFGVEPFFGLAIGAASLYVIPEEETTETHYSEKVTRSFASSWEVGASIINVGTANVDIEAKMTDLFIGRQLFGSINIGGRIYSIGATYRFLE